VDFGIFILMQQRHRSTPSGDIIRQAVEQVRLADELGFGTAWFAEHHFNNYGLCPSPLMMIAYCAAVTKKIKLGSAVIIAPLYSPPRLLAEIALADQFAGGRLQLGIGGGYQQFEFERFGVNLDYAKPMALEMLDIIERGLGSTKFSFDGDYFKLPQSAISIRPFRDEVPPIWIASGDPQLMTRALSSDYHLFISGLLGGNKRLAGQRARVDELATSLGKDPAKAKVAMLRFTFASESRKEVEHYIECARYQQRVAVSLKARRESTDDDYMVLEKPFDEELPLEKIAQNLPVGDIETCIERLVADIRVARPMHVAIQTQLGDLDHKVMMRQLETLATRVIPAVKKELGQEFLASLVA